MTHLCSGQRTLSFLLSESFPSEALELPAQEWGPVVWAADLAFVAGRKSSVTGRKY